MQNIEIKAKVQDLDRAKEIALSQGGRPMGIERQRDTYFQTRDGRLKLREIEGKPAQLIPYLRPDLSGPKKSDYCLLPVMEPEKLRELLAGILGVDKIVEKTREILLLENVRVHLDEVKGLGKFIEFEAVYSDPRMQQSEEEKVIRLLNLFNISQDDLEKSSYRELL